jgi:long-chain acyl-CoA synthetase
VGYEVTCWFLFLSFLARKKKREAHSIYSIASIYGKNKMEQVLDMSEELVKLFNEIERNFIKGKLDKEISIYFSLGDSSDEKWTVFAGPDKCIVKKGKAVEKADCVLKTSPDMFIKIVREGYEPDMTDFLLGRFKTNNPNLLEKFKKCVKL